MLTFNSNCSQRGSANKVQLAKCRHCQSFKIKFCFNFERYQNQKLYSMKSTGLCNPAKSSGKTWNGFEIRFSFSNSKFWTWNRFSHFSIRMQSCTRRVKRRINHLNESIIHEKHRTQHDCTFEVEPWCAPVWSLRNHQIHALQIVWNFVHCKHLFASTRWKSIF